MKITTHYKSDFEYTSVAEEGQSVKIDMKSENKTDLSPVQLLLSALAGCAAVEVALMIQKKRRKLIDLRIETEGTRRETNPRSFTKIHMTIILVSPDATLEELEKVAKLGIESYCSVRSSLNSEVTYECKIERE